MKRPAAQMTRRCAVCAVLTLAAATGVVGQEIDDRNEPVEIDFAACEPKQERVYVAFGSTTYQIVGPSRQGCVMLYGGEVENRTWDGFLNKTCVVPTSPGRLAFPKTKTGVDFSAIEEYCTETPRPWRR
ncbi:MAG: hypothetical protein HY353_05375, partial [Candidatus Omnitrophica bacterium]|nr:hypothetical protein [Candidatus Omnitrophota bacterium]